MQALRIAILQTHWPGDRAALQDTYRQLAAAAADEGANLICLPEFSLSPYFANSTDPAGFQWAEPLRDGPSDRFFGELARQHGVHLIGSLFEKTEEGYRDTATVHSPDGALVAFTRKVHIPAGEGYHEDHFFEGGAEFPVHDIGAAKLAVPTCYDQWFPETARICALNGAEFIFYPSAIGSEPTDPDFDSKDTWQTVMRGHAVANGVFVGAANRTGREGSVTFYGSSFVCDPTGRILAEAGRDSTEYILADLEPDVLTHYRDLFPLLHQRRPRVYQRLTEPVGTPPPARWQDYPLGEE